MSGGLAERRIENAVRSGGISHGPIYDAVFRQALPVARGAVLDFGAGTGAVASWLAGRPSPRSRPLTW